MEHPARAVSSAYPQMVCRKGGHSYRYSDPGLAKCRQRRACPDHSSHGQRQNPDCLSLGAAKADYRGFAGWPGTGSVCFARPAPWSAGQSLRGRAGHPAGRGMYRGGCADSGSRRRRDMRPGNLERLFTMDRRARRPVFKPLPVTALPLFMTTFQGVVEKGRTMEDLQGRLEQLFGYVGQAYLWRKPSCPPVWSPIIPPGRTASCKTVI